MRSAGGGVLVEEEERRRYVVRVARGRSSCSTARRTREYERAKDYETTQSGGFISRETASLSLGRPTQSTSYSSTFYFYVTSKTPYTILLPSATTPLDGHRARTNTPRRTRRNPTLLPRTFCSGLALGAIAAAATNLLLLGAYLATRRPPRERTRLLVPLQPPNVHPKSFHAVVVPAGGQHADGPPAHVLARLERAYELWSESPSPKPYIITTAWGTPHKPCPRDAAGFERHEAADNALFLVRRGVPPADILEESASLETVGNALFTRLLHTEPRGLRRLAIVNNRFHMKRTRAVFDHVFHVPPAGEALSAYELHYHEVEDRLPPDVLEARIKKEAASLPRFAHGGPWQKATPTLRALHDWLWKDNTAYATKRLLEQRKPVDPELLKSY